MRCSVTRSPPQLLDELIDRVGALLRQIGCRVSVLIASQAVRGCLEHRYSATQWMLGALRDVTLEDFGHRYRRVLLRAVAMAAVNAVDVHAALEIRYPTFKPVDLLLLDRLYSDHFSPPWQSSRFSALPQSSR